jgi:DNA modification methylase
LTKSEHYFYDYEAIMETAKWGWGDQTEKKSHPGTVGHLGGKKKSELPVKDKKNKRSVWKIATEPCSEAHFAAFPEKLVEPCILAGSRPGDIVLDIFSGSGTTERVAIRHGRRGIGLELNPKYIEISKRISRSSKGQLDLLHLQDH